MIGMLDSKKTFAYTLFARLTWHACRESRLINSNWGRKWRLKEAILRTSAKVRVYNDSLKDCFEKVTMVHFLWVLLDDVWMLKEGWAIDGSREAYTATTSGTLHVNTECVPGSSSPSNCMFVKNKESSEFINTNILYSIFFHLNRCTHIYIYIYIYI